MSVENILSKSVAGRVLCYVKGLGVEEFIPIFEARLTILHNISLTMKLKAFVMMVTLLAGAAFVFQGCNKCDVTGTVDFDSATQNFSIRYLVDSSGANYNTVWRQSQVGVVFDDEGGKGQFTSISEDISDGLIGPFTYTVGNPDVAKKGIFHDYMYVVTKDSFGIDTFQIKFYPQVDECHEFWSVIEYYKNGVLLDQLTGQESAVLEIRE
jgi:hypothetical protein